MFICSNNDGPVIRIGVTTVTGVQVNIGLHGTFPRPQEVTIDSTLVKGVVIDANSTYFVVTITLVPPVSSTIVCNAETISYQLQNSKWSLLSTFGAPKFLLGFYVGMNPIHLSLGVILPDCHTSTGCIQELYLIH